MSNTTSDRAKAWVLGALLAASSCTMQPAAKYPRAALEMPAEIAARYALDGPVHEASLVSIGRESDREFFRGRLECGDETAEFHVILPESDASRPFILLLPILAGGRELMWIVGSDLADRGFAVGWARRVESALSNGQRGRNLELLFRRTIVHNRMLLAWARRQATIDSRRMGLVGLSMGGMIGGAMLAVEPDLSGALCISGGDFADLVLTSAEPRVRRWRRWRAREDAIADLELFREFADHLQSDPARLGPYVSAERVLFVTARFDDVVPARNQDLLWESLGRPQRMQVPLSHYTSALALGPVLSEISTFLTDRFTAGYAEADRLLTTAGPR